MSSSAASTQTYESPSHSTSEEARHLDTLLKKLETVRRSSEPAAVLRLDDRRRHSKPRAKSDVLVEIEACTVQERGLCMRTGVRSSLDPTPVETVAADCIGRVVQLSTHARAVYGLGLHDRLAALCPFEYCGVGGRKGGVLGRYALVDAGFVVAVPKQLDAAQAACLIRLYMTAFQSIQLGITHHHPSQHDRYDTSQLLDQSILIQDGHTELGLATIHLAKALGAQIIFATAPSEHHSKLRHVGATPLGDRTFRWELFLTEKLSLVLLQDAVGANMLDHFLTVAGVVVKMDMWPQQQRQVSEPNVGCDELWNVHQLADRIRSSFEEAKFHLRLGCCSSYLTYPGVWASCKEDPNLWKEDLRYLMALLGEGRLNPHVGERICLEDLAAAQSNIEVYGKSDSIVCLPFQTKNKPSREVSCATASPKARLPDKSADNAIKSTTSMNTFSYAQDSGYIPRSQVDTTLSDFRRMNDGSRNDTYLKSSEAHLRTPTDYPFHYGGQQSRMYLTLEEHQDYVSSPVSRVDVDVGARPTTQHRSKETRSGSARRNRINQRIKTQQRQYGATGNECDRNALSLAKSSNAKTQWRKLRRSKGQTGSTSNQMSGQRTNPAETMPTSYESKEKIPVSSIEIEKTCSPRRMEVVDIPVIRDSRSDAEDDERMDDKETCTSSNVQSLMQYKSRVSSSNHHSCWSNTRNEKRIQEMPGPTSHLVSKKEDPSSSFRSLMSKWKSIEDGANHY